MSFRDNLASQGLDLSRNLLHCLLNGNPVVISLHIVSLRNTGNRDISNTEDKKNDLYLF